MEPSRACDLCGLDIGIKPFYLQRGNKRLQFCCDACLAIYQMLHEGEHPDSPGDTPISQGEHHERNDG